STTTWVAPVARWCTASSTFPARSAPPAPSGAAIEPPSSVPATGPMSARSSWNQHQAPLSLTVWTVGTCGDMATILPGLDSGFQELCRRAVVSEHVPHDLTCAHLHDRRRHVTGRARRRGRRTRSGGRAEGAGGGRRCRTHRVVADAR